MKKKGIVFGTSLIILGMISSGLAASVAWFIAEENTLRANVSGSVVEEYFHCGSGTQADPFVITRPMHYYHLVEFFQRKTELGSSARFGTDYLYFQIGYDLDGNASNGLEVYAYDNDGTTDDTYSKVLNMAYFAGDNALMPVGTSECPFFGYFDGGASSTASKCIKITNLNIKSQEDVVLHNQSTTTTRYTSDVGMFGYVSDNDGSGNSTVIENLYVENLTIDTTGAVANKNPTSGISHTSAHTDEINVGYIVGHLHAYTNKTALADATPLHDVYVNNAKILGGAAGAKNNFGYIGYVDTIDTHPSSDYALDKQIKALQDAAGEGQGQGTDWGGSINFREFNRRFYNHRNTFTYSSNKYLATYSTNYTKTSLAYGSALDTNVLNKDPDTNTSKIVYNLQGSGSHTISNDTMTLVGTAMPLAIGDDGEATSNNTGYIVSSSRSTSGTANGAVRSASYRNGYINNSLVDTAKTPRQVYSANNLLTYDKTKTEILTNKNKTYNANGRGTDNFVLIKDDMDGYNQNHTPANSYLTSYTKNDTTVPGATGLNLKKYNSSRQALDTILSGSQKKIHGIHFMNAAISTSNTETLPIVKINGQTYNNSSYPLLKNCIDFNVKESGIINFFGGAYYDHKVSGQNVSSADCFFSLSVVERNPSTHALTSVKTLSKIFKDNRDAKAYIYQYSDGNYSDTGTSTKSANVGDTVFDMQYLSATPPVQNALYYFEIPVNNGEFALGGVSGQDGGAYLIYLDISANESDEEQTEDQKNKIAEQTIFTQIEYLEDMSSGYVTNACFNIGFAIPSGATKNNFWVVVERDDDVFNVTVVNTSGNDFVLYVLLVDDDDDNNNDYPYTYTLTYNGGTTSQEYWYSGAWEGTSGGVALYPHTIVIS